jgi:hypothetical protein
MIPKWRIRNKVEGCYWVERRWFGFLWLAERTIEIENNLYVTRPYMYAKLITFPKMWDAINYVKAQIAEKEAAKKKAIERKTKTVRLIMEDGSMTTEDGTRVD